MIEHNTDDSDTSESDVSYLVWCEREGCDFEKTGTARNGYLAQRAASTYIFEHGLDTGHHETFLSVDTESEHEHRQ